MAKPLKHVIIGVGAGVLGMHRPALELASVHLVGVSDLSADVGRERAAALGCPFFPDVATMLRETAPDVAVILTPHPFHAALATACLEAGAHVLVEKPMAVHAGEADAMIGAAARAGRLLAVSFQHRFRPEVRAARRLIGAGRLGKLQHVDLTVAWPRTARYFRAATWRGTWAGEGGGVLMNQAPHNLDLLCYLLGAPARVVAWTRTTLHAIETEDTVQAMLEWPEGLLGSVHISTAEAGRPERLELVGTGGTLSPSPGALTFSRCETDFRTFVQESDDPFGAPTFGLERVALEAGAGDHAAVYRNLHAAIVQGAPLVCDGAEGRTSLELANAMTYSSYTRREVTLPLDRSAYAALLQDLTSGAVGALR
ncbi:Gfo/Idh/MocA family protein [Truepera radiovictrix]|nr:Gfo/Idh/MocA family oxidoreductase [Truepera radiovictrix]WMT56482.1 Gfo/Idh/MocA family oxidoreductase [Truepera radiovictrix]